MDGRPYGLGPSFAGPNLDGGVQRRPAGFLELVFLVMNSIDPRVGSTPDELKDFRSQGSVERAYLFEVRDTLFVLYHAIHFSKTILLCFKEAIEVSLLGGRL